MNKKLIWAFAAALVICGACVFTCCNDEDDNPAVSPEMDSSQFVTLTDAVTLSAKHSYRMASALGMAPSPRRA